MRLCGGNCGVGRGWGVPLLLLWYWDAGAEGARLPPPVQNAITGVTLTPSVADGDDWDDGAVYGDGAGDGDF